ncbi:MAG: DUF2721 domain-containing protein [Blastomonas sp.]
MDFTGSDRLGEISEIIRLAMAPAFLLVAMGGLLQLFASRLSRVVDRERVLAKAFHETEGEDHQRVVIELRTLDRRAGIVNVSIFFGVMSAVVVGLLIATLFLMGLLRVDLSGVIAGGFILAMLFLIAGLLCFVIEVRLAWRVIHVEEQLLELEG